MTTTARAVTPTPPPHAPAPVTDRVLANVRLLHGDTAADLLAGRS